MCPECGAEIKHAQYGTAWCTQCKRFVDAVPGYHAPEGDDGDPTVQEIADGLDATSAEAIQYAVDSVGAEDGDSELVFKALGWPCHTCDTVPRVAPLSRTIYCSTPCEDERAYKPADWIAKQKAAETEADPHSDLPTVTGEMLDGWTQEKQGEHCRKWPRPTESDLRAVARKACTAYDSPDTFNSAGFSQEFCKHFGLTKQSFDGGWVWAILAGRPWVVPLKGECHWRLVDHGAPEKPDPANTAYRDAEEWGAPEKAKRCPLPGCKGKAIRTWAMRDAVHCANLKRQPTARACKKSERREQLHRRLEDLKALMKNVNTASVRPERPWLYVDDVVAILEQIVA